MLARTLPIELDNTSNIRLLTGNFKGWHSLYEIWLLNLRFNFGSGADSKEINYIYFQNKSFQKEEEIE